MHTINVFFTIIRFRFMARFEYPGAFIAGIIAQWTAYGIDTLLMFLMVWQFGSLAGWLPVEVIFMYALGLLTYALAASFVFHMSGAFAQMSVNGALDEALVRPMPPLLYLMATYYSAGYVSHITLTTAALIVSIIQLNASWTVLQWAWLFVLIISGAVIQGCMMLLCSMPSLRTRSRAPTGVLFWQVRDLVQYPISIYPRIIQFVFAVLLPYGFVSFYPIQVLLGKNDGIFAGAAMWLSPVVAALLVAASALAWRAATRRYESAGT